MLVSACMYCDKTKHDKTVSNQRNLFPKFLWVSQGDGDMCDINIMNLGNSMAPNQSELLYACLPLCVSLSVSLCYALISVVIS